MIQKYFNADKLTNYDKISSIIYLLLTLMILKITVIFNDIEIQKLIVLGYTLMTPLFIYTINYKSLRNLKMFIVWIGFGLIHLYLFNQLSDNLNL